MKTITKTTTRLGNSAGVLLPASWLNAIVNVKLVESPKNYSELINQLFIILKKELPSIKSLMIAGSYAREEQTKNSDIDVIILNNENKHKKIGKFDMLYLTEKKIKQDLEKNALPLLPMLREAKPIINGNLINKYAKYPINKKNVKWHIDTTKTMMQEVKKDIEFSKRLKENTSYASVYSLVLRLRTLYIIECLIKKKAWKNKEFLNLLKKITSSLNIYEEYSKIKSSKKTAKNSKVNIEKAEKLMDYINKKTKEIEKCLNEKKD
ncbi:MAG: nucleotidyltransferase domain-containing protein [Nanoarchaeota archaeon]|nr:nucleotidyltransferase domain-containing protein [Nanoarchaeota archaeon]